MQLHHQWVREQNQQLQQQRQQQRRVKDKRSTPVFKRNHANDCNKNFNAEALCTCDGDGNKKLNADVRTDIGSLMWIGSSQRGREGFTIYI